MLSAFSTAPLRRLPARESEHPATDEARAPLISAMGAPGVNDNNPHNIAVQPDGDYVDAWQAAGIVFWATQIIDSVTFINGNVTRAISKPMSVCRSVLTAKA